MLHLICTEIASKDDDRVTEAHNTASRVSQCAIFKELQQHLEDIGVSLFDFIKQHHTIGLTPHLICQFAAIVVAYIASRRTNKPARGMLLAKLAHIDLNQCVIRAKHLTGKHARQLGLTNTSWPHKDKATDRPLAARHPTTTAPNSTSNFANRFFLANQIFAKVFLKITQELRLTCADFLNWDVCHHSNGMSNIILGEHQWSFATLLATCLLKLVGQLANTLLIESGALIVFCCYGIFHFLIQCFELTNILALLAWLMSLLNAY